jgi:secernin
VPHHRLGAPAPPLLGSVGPMCDTLVVVAPDRVLFAKNSDRNPNESQLLDWHRRRIHPVGDRLRCTWIEIDQVAETYAVLLSRPYWMWGAEMGANEHGVVIGNEAVFTDMPYASTGLTGMDLLRLALERADTARSAVEIITVLLGRHGQGGGCGHEDRSFAYHNSFLVADPTEAYVLETAGPLWDVERVASGLRSISNGLTIPGFDRHSATLPTYLAKSRVRQAITGSCAASSPSDLMAVLRSHGAKGPAPRWSPVIGAKAAPCMHAGGGIRATSQTTGSWVAELRHDGEHRHWATATAAPCTSLFKPVRVDQALALGPDPTDRFDPDTLWWRHELLHRAVLADPERLIPLLAAERDRIEDRWLGTPPDPSAAFMEADEVTSRWIEAVHAADGPDRRPRWARRYWEARDRRAGMPHADQGARSR